MWLKFLLLIISLLFISTMPSYKFYRRCNEKCLPCKTEKLAQNEDEDEVEVVNIDEMNEECFNHMNESKSLTYCSGFKFVYNPFKDIVRRKHVLPACVRCAQCLAISKEVRKLFEDIIADCKTTEPNVARIKVNEKFSENFCKQSFTSYDLRIYNGKTIFGKMSDCGNHLRTEFDGQWPTMLKNMCMLFIVQLNIDSKYSLFHQFWMGYKNTDELICHGDGVFRECKNLVNETNDENLSSEKPEQSFWASCFF